MITQAELAKHWNISRQAAHLRVKAGCPLTSLIAADRWRGRRETKRAATVAEVKAAPKGPGRPPKIQPPSDTGDSLLDARNNSITVARTAFKEYQHACSKNLPTRSHRLSEHNKAVQAQIASERAYREEMERRNILVPKSTITEICRRSLDTVLRLINKLPSEQGPQCNPQDPLMAVKVLQRKVDEIKSAAQGALSSL